MSISKYIDGGKNHTITVGEGWESITVTLVRGGPIEVVVVNKMTRNAVVTIAAPNKPVTESLSAAASVIIKATHKARVSFTIQKPAERDPHRNKDWWKKPMR